MNETLDTYGLNAGYIEELYERFLQNPASVDAETRTYFSSGQGAAGNVSASSPNAPLAQDTASNKQIENELPLSIEKVVAAARLGRIIRGVRPP